MKRIGIDIGDTSIKTGPFEVTGELPDKWGVKARKEDGGSQIPPNVAASTREEIKRHGLDLKANLAGVGMRVPGPVLSDGYVEVYVNLGWRGLNPQEKLSRLLDGILIKSGNDTNVVALGEIWQGDGRGYDDLVMLTLGTGMSGAAITDQKTIVGKHGLGDEIGHTHVRDEE